MTPLVVSLIGPLKIRRCMPLGKEGGERKGMGRLPERESMSILVVLIGLK